VLFNLIIIIIIIIIIICKIIPKQDWAVPEGSRKLTHEGGRVSPKHRPPLSPRRIVATYFC